MSAISVQLSSNYTICGRLFRYNSIFCLECLLYLFSSPAIIQSVADYLGIKNTVGENINGSTKMLNYYGSIYLIISVSNIRLFSIAPCKVIALNLLCFIYGIISLLLFLIAKSNFNFLKYFKGCFRGQLSG